MEAGFRKKHENTYRVFFVLYPSGVEIYPLSDLVPFNGFFMVNLG